MLHERNGNILYSSADIICQQVNCQGVMGAGLAKEIRNMYIDVYIAYKNRCELGNCLGTALLVNVKPNQSIACLFGQDGYGRNRCYTNYSALRNALASLIKGRERYTFAVPYRLGSGLAGGNWNVIKQILEEEFINSTCEIWRLS